MHDCMQSVMSVKEMAEKDTVRDYIKVPPQWMMALITQSLGMM